MISVNPDLVHHLRNYNQLMAVNTSLYFLSSFNSNAYAVGNKILQHYSQNRKRPNQNKLRVSTLLSQCPDITTKSSTMIRYKLEDALNLLAQPITSNFDNSEYPPIISWTYLYKGNPVTPAFIGAKRLREHIWQDLIIQFEVLNWNRRAKLTKPVDLIACTREELAFGKQHVICSGNHLTKEPVDEESKIEEYSQAV